MQAASQDRWRVPLALLALGAVPVAAGAFRLAQIGAGAVTPDNARFLAAPWPAIVHIVGATLYCMLGAFQFSVGLRREHPRKHRIAGRLLACCGMAAALSGLWMTLFYPAAGVDGPALDALRLLAGTAMAASLVLGVAAAARRDLAAHGAWMMRAYALGMGAGTQALTHLPWLLLPALYGEPARTASMAAGWIINLAVVEWLLARRATVRLGRAPA